MDSGFLTSIISGSGSFSKFSIATFFDDYSNPSEQPVKDTTGIGTTWLHNSEASYREKQISHMIKHIAYCTGIIPLIVLVAKIFAQYFPEVKQTDITPTQPQNDIALKDAVTIQSDMRAKLARNELKELKAAVTIQSAMRAKLAQNKLKELKAAVTIQSRFRCLKAQRMFPVLMKAHKTLTRVLQELVSSEIKNFDTVSSKFNQLLNSGPNTYLKNQNHAEQLKNALDFFQSHLRRNESVLNQMKAIVPGFCEDQTSSLKNIPPIKLEECVRAISSLILSKEFGEFMDSQIELTQQKRIFDEIIDLEKINRKIKHWEIFNPHTLAGYQRLTRYQLLGKEIGENAQIACSAEIAPLIQNATIKLIEKVAKYNTWKRMDDLNTLNRNHTSAQQLVDSYRFYHPGYWFNGKKQAQEELEIIENNRNFMITPILNRPLKEIPDPESDDPKVQNFHSQVVSGIRKSAERAHMMLSSSIDKKTALTPDELSELTELKETLRKALPWLKKEPELESLIKTIIEE